MLLLTHHNTSKMHKLLAILVQLRNSSCFLKKIRRIHPTLPQMHYRSFFDLVSLFIDLDLPAKYWLTNRLEADNIITDGFFDIGHAGSAVKFPTLQHLLSAPADNKREVLLVDSKKDQFLTYLSQWLSEIISMRGTEDAIITIANVVALVCGGQVDQTQIANYPFKFRITELKLQNSSNVIPIGTVNKGTFYHRALLFKTLCDRIGLSPCILVRGDYNRAWNIIDLKNTVVTGISVNRLADVPPTFVQQWKSKLECLELKVHDIPPIDGAYIVDLMSEPGKLMPISSPEAESYQRI